MKKRRSHHLVVGQNFLRQLSADPNSVAFLEGDVKTAAANGTTRQRNFSFPANAESTSRTKVVTFDEPQLIAVSPTPTIFESDAEIDAEQELVKPAVECSQLGILDRSEDGPRLSIGGIVTYIHRKAWKKQQKSSDDSNRKSSSTQPVSSTKQSTSSKTSKESLESCSNQPEDSTAAPSVCSLRGQVRLAANTKDVSFPNDRVFFLSPLANIPLVVSSWISYRTPSQMKSAAHRTRHESSTSSQQPTLHPFCFAENEELSYRHLLVPYRYRLSRYSPAVRSLSTSNKRRLISCSEDGEHPTSEPHNAKKQHALLMDLFSRSSSVEPQASRNEADSCSTSSYMEASHELNTCFVYDIGILNNATFGAAHHKLTFRFPFYMTSVIEYIDATELKQQINDKFKQKFPHVQLSYSKFKSLKREMRDICDAAECDLLTVATAYVYFEKLVLKAMINKENRKCVAGVCLLLAAKFNDARGDQLKIFIDLIETAFRLDSGQLFELELPVVVALDFNLQLPDYEVFQHYQQLVSGIQL